MPLHTHSLQKKGARLTTKDVLEHLSVSENILGECDGGGKGFPHHQRALWPLAQSALWQLRGEFALLACCHPPTLREWGVGAPRPRPPHPFLQRG
eukprot:1912190-Amphidinium_carterae.2